MSAADIGAARPGSRAAGRLQTVLVLLVTAAVIGGAALAIERPWEDGGFTSVQIRGDATAVTVRVGDAPPDFTAVTLEGTEVSLADYAGQPVWLTFGATWCADCRAEAPDLQATWERYRERGLVILAVFIDEDAPTVEGYASRVGLTFPMIPDPGTRLAGKYRLLGVPTHYFIGTDGRVQEIRLGGLKPQDMDQLVTALFN
jgi:cytochrome c biogenesis protein CcmG, thiol:disulfide interchange protein DsbE